jgi:hypothetical protein
MPDHAGDRGAVFPVLEPHDHLHIKQIRTSQGIPLEILVCQINPICASQLMSVKDSLRVPNGGSRTHQVAVARHREMASAPVARVSSVVVPHRR